MNKLFTFIAFAAMGLTAAAQELVAIEEPTDTIADTTYLIDEVWAQLDSVPQPTVKSAFTRFTGTIYRPYDFIAADTLSVADTPIDPASPLAWVQRESRMFAAARAAIQRFTLRRPDLVDYIEAQLPEAPKKYVVEVDPTTAMVTVNEIAPAVAATAPPTPAEVRRQNWFNKFSTNLQFSQAYVSPNWYQGGNSSLNMIFDFQYNTKLNQKFYPKLLFETNFQWRTAMTSTNEDEARAYTFTENRFQINSTFGLKAFNNHWYYTVNGMLKTPVFNSYKPNQPLDRQDRTSSFMSPGELNIGVGMTYTLNKGKFNLKLSLSPLAYNMKTMIDPKVRRRHWIDNEDHERRVIHSYGSSGELTWNWQIVSQVKWNSRIFAFTDYHMAYADWQNQFQFIINRFLTANVNVDMRWDTTKKYRLNNPESKWSRLQLREILSLGFTYTISH